MCCAIGNTGDANTKDNQESGIRLGRLKKTGDKHKPTVATFDEHDIQKMKNGVQNVVKAAAPLGKCMDYIPDDLSTFQHTCHDCIVAFLTVSSSDAMNAELARWQELCKRHEQEQERRRQKSDLSLTDLNNELQEV